MQFEHRFSPFAPLLLAAALLTACSTGTGGDSAGGAIRVVAGTNVWGNIAEQIGGSAVQVTSIIGNPNVDPHAYETDVRDAAAVDRARIVIENGVSYDDFLAKLVSAGHRSDLAVVTVANVVGAGSAANPHLWYSPDFVVRAARAIEVELVRAAPADADLFARNLAAFLAGEKRVTAAISTIKARHNGEPVAYTEPLPGYLVEAAGLHLATPEAFSKALEDGTDPGPADSAAFEHALTAHTVAVLIYNSQVTDSETARLRDLARRGGVPVVPMSETLPAGKSFQAWQADQVRALLAGLDAS